MEEHLRELCSRILLTVKALSGSGRGAFVFVKTDREHKLRDLAIMVAQSLSNSKDEPLPIYVVQGHIRGEHGWPFSRIKKGPRLRLEPDGQMVTETGGLILPQDRPVVLLAEYFDCFEANDQRAYAHLVDGDGGDYALHEGSILIAGLVSTNPGQLETGTANRGIHFELA